MIKSIEKTSAGRFDSACPSDLMLQDLLDDGLPEDEQAELTAHLDDCDECRSRLEEAAGGPDVWSAASRNLRQDKLAVGSNLQGFADTLEAMKGTTQSIPLERGPARRDEQGDEKFDFLQPCAKSDRIGRLGPYEIIEVVGRGGMGVVFKAFDPALHRVVAIKVIRDPLGQPSNARERFRREARASAAVKNDHVVAIHAIEESATHPYLVMEFIQGRSLEDRLQAGDRLGWQEIATIGAEIASGLAAAHREGLIHRDIKPANILLDDATGRVKISDFGLARSLDDSSLTQHGCVAGTPEYIAPEQATGGQIDHRADFFSLGSVLYALCTGHPPFAADNTLAVLRRTREETPAPISDFRDDVPAALQAIIARLLEKEPGNRFATAAETAEALQTVASTNHAAVAMVKQKNVAQTRGRRRRIARLALATSLLVAVGFCISEAFGLTNLVATVAAVGDSNGAAQNEQRSTATAAEDPAGADANAAADNAANAAELPDAAGQPPRVQIVTPDALLRERIRQEKDTLERAPSPHLVRKFQGHKGPVNGLAITPDGGKIVSCSGWPVGDRTVRLWNVETAKEIRSFDTASAPQDPGLSGPREAPGEFFDVAVTPDGKLAITGGTGGAVCVWNIATGKLVRTFDKHTDTVYAVAVSADGKQALTGGRDQVGRLWDIATGQELLRLPNHRSYIRSVAISPDGTRALTAGLDQVVRLWDLENAEEIRTIKSAAWVWSVAFAPSGDVAAAASGNGISLWDLESGKLIRILRGHRSPVTSVAFSPDGGRLLSGSYDQTVRLWDVEEGRELQTYLGHRDWVWVVKFSPDGRQAVSAGGGRNLPTVGYDPGVDFDIRLWKLPPQEPRVAKPK